MHGRPWCKQVWSSCSRSPWSPPFPFTRSVSFHRAPCAHLQPCSASLTAVVSDTVSSVAKFERIDLAQPRRLVGSHFALDSNPLSAAVYNTRSRVIDSMPAPENDPAGATPALKVSGPVLRDSTFQSVDADHHITHRTADGAFRCSTMSSWTSSMICSKTRGRATRTPLRRRSRTPSASCATRTTRVPSYWASRRSRPCFIWLQRLDSGDSTSSTPWPSTSVVST